MAFGLLPEGLFIKRLDDIKTELTASLQAAFGPGINLLPTSVLGQIMGIMAEREALIWELAQAVYDASYPDTASDQNLDNVVAITGIARLEATPSLALINAIGTLATLIPAGSQVSVQGDPSIVFTTDADGTIAAGTDEVQDITFDATPDSGEFTLNFNGDVTADILFSDNAAAVEAALEALPSITSVSVAGSFAAGFTVTFDGVDGLQPQNLLVEESNTLLLVATPVVITIAETTPGLLPNVDIAVTAVTAGAFPAPAGSITVIDTPVGGWNSVNNASDAVIGRNRETDAELRVRRAQSLAFPGSATVNGILSALLQTVDVREARVFQNITDVVDGFGRPPHSIEAVVLGGADQDIFQTVFDNVAAGIQTFGGVPGIVVDEQGFSQAVNFSRPTEIDIFIEIDVTSTPEFTVGGAALIAQAIVDYAALNFGIGDDIIVHGAPSIEAAVICGDVTGISDLVFRVGTSVFPVSDANVAIAPDEIGAFDTANMVIVVS